MGSLFRFLLQSRSKTGIDFSVYNLCNRPDEYYPTPASNAELIPQAFARGQASDNP
jgi:hypothetical protein